MRAKKLRGQLAALHAEAETILKAAEARGDGLTPEEKDTVKAKQAEMAKLREDIALFDEMGEAPVAPHDPAPEPKGAKGFASIGEQLVAIHRGGRDPRLLAAASGLNEGVPSEGGFLLQSDFATELTNKAFETGLLASRVRVQEIGPGANGLKMNLANETSRASTRYGGILAYWAAEAGQKTSSKPAFRQWDYNLQKLIGLWYVTDELLQDAVAMNSVVNEWFSDEFGFQLDDAIYNGTGAGRPLGILNAPCLVTVAKENGQTASTIVADNIYKMYARMPAGSLSNAVWAINQACWPQLFKLSQAVGVGGVPLFIPAGGINQAPAGTLLGRPIVPIEQAAALGTVGDIAFCDFRQYLAIRKGGAQSASSIHIRFDYDETCFRVVLRFNGAPIPNSALTPYKGSDTVSPFVVLATRA